MTIYPQDSILKQHRQVHCGFRGEGANTAFALSFGDLKHQGMDRFLKGNNRLYNDRVTLLLDVSKRRERTLKHACSEQLHPQQAKEEAARVSADGEEWDWESALTGQSV